MKTEAGISSSTEDDAGRLRARATEMLVGVGIFASIMHFAVVIFMAAVLWPVSNHTFIIVWAIGLGASVLFQIALIERKGGRTLTIKEAALVQKYYDGAALGVGFFWGFAGVVLFPEADPGRVLFLIFVMGGMAMSSVSTQHVYLRTCLFSIIPSIAPLGVRYIFSDLPFNMASGALLLVYSVVLVNMAIRLYHFAHRAFTMQLEQERLLEKLSTQAIALNDARSDAEQANAAKSRFLAQASHDLRQPLHAISLFVESLPEARNTAEHDNIMNRVRQSLDVLTKLFDSLLDVTLLDTGGLEVRLTVFRPSDTIDEVRQDFGLVAEASRVEIRTIGSSLAVKNDPVLLRRMLQNLISNAIRHTEGGRVLIGCRRREGKLCIDVTDTGPGIEAIDQKRVFAEFTRLASARMGASAQPGLGLGLSIVKRIAEELGLNISVFSRVGHGSTFRIGGLDIADAKDIDKGAAAPSPQGVVNGASVFVLDDDPETLAATQMLLERWGCNVQISQDWQDLDDATMDVMICDYEISPEKNGLDVMNEMAASPAGAPPTIMISGNTSAELRREAEARSIPLLHKPIRPAQLRSALLNALAVSGKSS